MTGSPRRLPTAGGRVVFALAFALTSPALAQQPVGPPFSESIVVTAERGPRTASDTPAEVEVLDRAAIERLPALTLGELLAILPGVQASFAGVASAQSAFVLPDLTGAEVAYVVPAPGRAVRLGWDLEL